MTTLDYRENRSNGKSLSKAIEFKRQFKEVGVEADLDNIIEVLCTE